MYNELVELEDFEAEYNTKLNEFRTIKEIGELDNYLDGLQELYEAILIFYGAESKKMTNDTEQEYLKEVAKLGQKIGDFINQDNIIDRMSEIVNIINAEFIKQEKEIEELQSSLNKLEDESGNIGDDLKKISGLETKIAGFDKDVNDLKIKVTEYDQSVLKTMAIFFSIFTMIAGNISIISNAGKLEVQHFLSVIFIVNSTIILAIFSLFYAISAENPPKKLILWMPIIGLILGLGILFLYPILTK